MTPDIALAAANFVLCSAIGLVSGCRLSQMSMQTTRAWFRLKYAALFTLATASGFSWWLFGVSLGWWQVAPAGVVLACLLTRAPLWRAGIPDYARSGPVPLDEPLLSIPHGKGDEP